MVIPEEREGRDEYNTLLNRDPTPANQQAYGVGAATTIDQNDTRRGGLIPMTTISNIRPKVLRNKFLYSKIKFFYFFGRLLLICENFEVNFPH
jgi:hypothetical protein